MEKTSNAKKIGEKPTGALNLSIRSSRCLHEARIKTIGALVQKTTRELLGIKNFGRKSLREVREALAEHGLSLDE